MKISLVVCTRNRESQLALALEAFARIDFPGPWELVLVNNASTDSTQQRLEEFRSQGSCQVRIIEEAMPGLGTARNSGSLAATGEIVAFTDDDCYPAPDFLTQVVACFESRSNLGFLGGSILLHDPTDYPITIQTKADMVEIPASSFIPAGLVQGANLAVRKSALVQAQGFDERFGAGRPFPCEDVDLIARISVNGWTGLYSPAPLVYHHHQRKEIHAIELRKLYDKGRGAYYAKCLLHSKLRFIYLRSWISKIRWQPNDVSIREIKAALHFFFLNLWVPATRRRW